MKKSMAALLTGLLSVFVQFVFAENIKSEKAVVSKATVYLRGALLTCSSDFIAQPGMNKFVFEGVSPNLDPNSLQASAKGNVVIMDVKYRVALNELPGKELPKQLDRIIKQTTDSVTLLNYEIDEINEQMQNLASEKNILLNYRLLKGESQRDTLDMFKDGIVFLRARLNNISNETAILKKKLFLKNNIKQQLEARVSELKKVNQAGNKPQQESIPVIEVQVFSEAAANAKVAVSFYVDQAAWLPVYDIRASANGNVDLFYKGEIRQQTNMDWSNIDLTLSTGNPALATSKPVLTPFYLSFVQNYRKKFNNESLELLSKAGATAATRETDLSKDEIMLDAKTLAAYTTEQEGMLQTEYEIRLKYSIPHGDQMQMVVIQNKALNTSYRYSAVPKLDMNAYLLAELYDLNELNLIPGSSRIYFDGAYIGKSVLNPNVFEDTLQLSMGRDRTISVVRKKVKGSVKERIFADEKILTISYELTVKNNKSTGLTLDLTDQIPVSQDPSIKVELINSSGATLKEETGLLSWKVPLKSMESKKVQFTYEVKMPKNKSLAGL